MTETEFNVTEKEAEIVVDLVKITQKIAADEFQKRREELKAEILAELKEELKAEIIAELKSNGV